MHEPLSFTLERLARLTGALLKGDGSHLITGIEDLDSANPSQAAFLENPRYERQMKNSQAGVVFIHPTVSCIEGRNYLVTETPSLAFQKVIELFLKPALSGFEGIHPSAVIHSESELGENVTVGPCAVIDRKSRIGRGSHIGAGCFVGAEVTIGEDCLLHPKSVVRERSVLGNRVILQPGAIVGSCGYGYHTDKKGHHSPLKQLGNVVIEDDVEIGANTTIDRARFKTTVIRKGSKIDNLVQIAHQVSIGEHNLIVSQTGIAGSSTTGNHVVLAGQVGIVGHISIADRVVLAARSAVIKSIEAGGVYSGAPALPIMEFNEQAVHIRNIGKLMKRVAALEQALSKKT